MNPEDWYCLGFATGALTILAVGVLIPGGRPDRLDNGDPDPEEGTPEDEVDYGGPVAVQ